MKCMLSTLLLLSAFFIPGGYTLRPEYLIVFALGSITIISHGGMALNALKVEVLLIFLLIIFAALSLMGQALMKDYFNPRDYMIILRYIVYILAIFSGFSLAAKRGPLFLNKLTIYTIVLISISISFMQYYNLMDINSTMVPMYNNRYETLITGDSWRRIIGTMGNANYWGLLLGATLIWSTLKSLNKKSIFHFSLLIPILIGIIMTGSRSSLIATIFVAFLGIAIQAGIFNNSSVFQKLITSLSIILIATVLFSTFSIFIENYYANTNRFAINNTATMFARFDYWLKGISQMSEHPYQLLLGRGPSKSTDIVFGDNIYILIFRDYGVFSILTFMTLIFVILKRLFYRFRHASGKAKEMYLVGLLCFILLFMFDLSADAWFYIKISIPALFWYGFMIGDFFYKEMDNENGNIPQPDKLEFTEGFYYGSA